MYVGNFRFIQLSARLLFGVVCGVMVSSCSANDCIPSDEAEQTFVVQLRSGAAAGVVETLPDYIASCGGSGILYSVLAEAYFVSGMFIEAVDQYEFIAQYSNLDLREDAMFAQALEQIGSRSEAIAHLVRRLDSLRPDDAPSSLQSLLMSSSSPAWVRLYSELGRMQFEEGDAEGAKEVMREGLLLNPASDELFEIYIMLLEQTGSHSEVQEVIDAICRLNGRRFSARCSA